MPKIDKERLKILLDKEKECVEVEHKNFSLGADNQNLTKAMGVLNKKLESYDEFKKIVDEEYGDSIDFLGIQWSALAWKLNILPEGGEAFIKSIKDDVRALVKSLLIKKEKVKTDASKKGTTKQV